ncbi:hypothetical protein [Georgenia deserti]|uniref:NAD-dependent epimerase/dehydratase family protein n=1 Tax=Georgenia deserti TaxID=2093781 RepID=A0ABW4L322_9MICO
MKIVIAGGSGSLGRALAADLAAPGHETVVLTRSPGRADYGGADVREVAWDAHTVGDWADELRPTAEGGGRRRQSRREARGLPPDRGQHRPAA